MEYASFLEMTASTKFSHVGSSVYYRARAFAREILEGSVASQYAVLEDYCKQIIATNPGMHLVLRFKAL
jgi:hypothetical protein